MMPVLSCKSILNTSALVLGLGWVIDKGYGHSGPQVTQHCFWMDLREQRPSSFSLSQKRDDKVFFLQTGPVKRLYL